MLALHVLFNESVYCCSSVFVVIVIQLLKQISHITYLDVNYAAWSATTGINQLESIKAINHTTLLDECS